MKTSNWSWSKYWAERRERERRERALESYPVVRNRGDIERLMRAWDSTHPPIYRDIIPRLDLVGI